MRYSARMATTAMIAKIHTLKAQAGLDDETYRDLLENESGFRSAKKLSVVDAGRVIERLSQSTNASGVRGAVAGLDTSFGRKLRALWLSGYNLGLIRDRTDRAMLAFLERQTGVSHTRFLKDAKSGAAAVEGLKAWLARAGGVEWPKSSLLACADKHAVLAAQWQRLIALQAAPRCGFDATAFKAAGVNSWDKFESIHFVEVQKSLGRMIRAAQAMNEINEGALQ